MGWARMEQLETWFITFENLQCGKRGNWPKFDMREESKRVATYIERPSSECFSFFTFTTWPSHIQAMSSSYENVYFFIFSCVKRSFKIKKNPNDCKSTKLFKLFMYNTTCRMSCDCKDLQIFKRQSHVNKKFSSTAADYKLSTLKKIFFPT